VTEERVEFGGGEAELHGTLLSPAANGPLPAIVMVGGSDWGVRAQVRGEADFFISFGLAALIFDARGTGESTGDRVCSFDQTASDIAAGVDFLASRAEIDTHKIGIFGRSSGGWLAPLAASRTNKAGFLVLFVPPATPPAREEMTRRMNELRGAGLKGDDLALAERFLTSYFRATLSDADWQNYEAMRPAVEHQAWADIAGGIMTKGDDDYRWDQLNMHYDPIPALANVKCPVLALHGERDRNVVPADNLPLMQAALQRAGNPDVVLTIIPQADHGLRRTELDHAAPLHRATGYAPETWNAVVEWLTQRNLRGAQRAG
jgi:hypothetical protein